MQFTANRIGAWLLPVAMGTLMDVTRSPGAALLLLGVVNLVAAGFAFAIRETGWRKGESAFSAPQHTGG
jgi:hypothetical protein